MPSGVRNRLLLVLLIGACRTPSDTTAAPAATSLSDPDSTEPRSMKPASRPAPGPNAGQSLIGRELGTKGAIIVEGVAADGSWALVCQAREDTNGDGRIEVNLGYHGDTYGDTMRPYLIRGDGPGEEIATLVDFDPEGGHIAYLQNGKLLVEHPRTGRIIDLSARGAVASDDDSPLYAHRAAQFDRSGSSVLYLRSIDARLHAVVHRLEDGQETIFDPGPGQLWRAFIGPRGAWVTLWVLTADTDLDGKIAPPQVRTSLGPRRCRGRIASYSTFGGSGDQPTTRFAFRGGVAREIDGVVGYLGGDLMLRAEDGAIQLDDGRSTKEIIPAACGAQIVGIDRHRGRIIAICRAEARTPLRWYDRSGAVKDLGQISRYAKDDHLFPASRHFLAQAKDAHGLIIDLETGRRRSIDGRQQVVATTSAFTLVNRAGTIVLLTPEGERVLASINTDYPTTLVRGDYAAVDRYVFHLKSGRLVGRVEGPPVGLSENGEILVSRDLPMLARSLDAGPLKWVQPMPVDDPPRRSEPSFEPRKP